MNIEELLRQDAERLDAGEDVRVAVELLKPHLAVASLEAKRRIRQRRERRIFLIALVPVALMLFFIANALLKGNFALVKALCMPVGLLSAGTLLTLPLLERFLPRYHER